MKINISPYEDKLRLT